MAPDRQKEAANRAVDCYGWAPGANVTLRNPMGHLLLLEALRLFFGKNQNFGASLCLFGAGVCLLNFFEPICFLCLLERMQACWRQIWASWSLFSSGALSPFILGFWS